MHRLQWHHEPARSFRAQQQQSHTYKGLRHKDLRDEGLCRLMSRPDLHSSQPQTLEFIYRK